MSINASSEPALFAPTNLLALPAPIEEGVSDKPMKVLEPPPPPPPPVTPEKINPFPAAFTTTE